jgi:hypothetical protein
VGAWAVRSPTFPWTPVGADPVILALGTVFDADAADDLSASYTLATSPSTATNAVTRFLELLPQSQPAA